MSVHLVDVPAGAVGVHDEWIAMPDGVRLHARIWAPHDADRAPVPALLEYLPYRLDDWTSVRDSERHPYYAAHGYASVRVDLRGSGSSAGIFDDEYSEQELDDGVAVVEWLAAQPWCSGRVGMFGISWGGFNSLQVAARAPEALRAVVTVCSTDDRYDNDVHYIGGAVLGIDMAAWGATMLAFASRPPRPEVVGDAWVERWRERLEQQRPLAPIWLSHQERDDYWRHGSVCEDYGSIRAAVLAVGGWADPYHDTVLRLLDHLECPRKGILGPWAHQYPDRAVAPGPPIGFLQETLRWWDRWLKDADTGVESDPDLRVWLNDTDPPAPYVEDASGRWVGVPDWPVAADRMRIALAAPGSPTVQVRSPWATGQDAGRFFPFGNRADLPPDQRAEDGRSVVVDEPVGPHGLTVLGSPVVRLRLSSDCDRGHVVVRLCDVAPDGSSRLVTRGVLNLLDRRGPERVDLLVPGQAEDVVVVLGGAGHCFGPGHRVRVALSNHYWPWVWPHPVDDTLTVDLARSEVQLPLVPADTVSVEFPPAEHARPLPTRVPDDTGPDRPARTVRTDVGTAETTLTVDPGYGGTRLHPDGLTYREDATESYGIREGEPHSAWAESHWQVSYDAGTWRARLETRSRITATPAEFVVENHVSATAGREGTPDEVVAVRSFTDRVARTSA